MPSRGSLKGFDVLEGDHEAIHADILRVVEAANGLLHAWRRSRRPPRCDGRLCRHQRTLLQSLVRHLDDEEDLIVPVILDQGERKLFYG